jgi:putative membrane protein
VSVVANVLVLVVAAIHVYILVLEMFLWRTERGRRSFGTDQAFADQSATLAANQGLYNGILAAGLLWGVIAADPVGFQVKLFFLAAVAVAGIYGAATVNCRILFVQTAPAVIALAAVLLATWRTTESVGGSVGRQELNERYRGHWQVEVEAQPAVGADRKAALGLELVQPVGGSQSYPG